jgi:hypothetical protein
MTRPPGLRELHTIARQVVRHIAAGTGFTSIITIRMGSDGMPVITNTGFSALRLDASYEKLLDTYTQQLEHVYPRGFPAYACALILPERDVADLHDHETGDSLAHVFTVGPNPFNVEATHSAVSGKLGTLMRALADTQPPQRATGRAFLNQPGAHVVVLGPVPQERPPGHHGRPR